MDSAVVLRHGTLALIGLNIDRTALLDCDNLESSFSENCRLRDGPGSHITILSAAELKTLKLNIKDVKEMFASVSESWVDCGLGCIKKPTLVFFKVILWQAANEIRARLGLKHKDFHITVGFENYWYSQCIQGAWMHLNQGYQHSRMIGLHLSSTRWLISLKTHVKSKNQKRLKKALLYINYSEILTRNSNNGQAPVLNSKCALLFQLKEYQLLLDCAVELYHLSPQSKVKIFYGDACYKLQLYKQSSRAYWSALLDSNITNNVDRTSMENYLLSSLAKCQLHCSVLLTEVFESELTLSINSGGFRLQHLERRSDPIFTMTYFWR